MVRRAVSTSPESPAHLNHHISQAQTPTSSTSSLSSSSDTQHQQHSPQQPPQQQQPQQQQHSPQSSLQQQPQQQHHPHQHLQTPPHHHAHVHLPHENGHSIFLTAAPYSPEYFPEHSYYLPHHGEYGPASQHSGHICPVHDYGPVTVPMVSQNGTPPMAMPVQVPPGHVMQQIVDESGTLRHVILSTQHQQLGQGGVQHHLHGHFINGSTPPFFNPLAASYQAGPGSGTPHLYQTPLMTNAGVGTVAAAVAAANASAGGVGAATHTLHTPQSNMNHSPSPPHSNNNQYHKDERSIRQHTKLVRKLESQKQRELNASIVTPINSPRKHTEVNGNVRKHQLQQQQQPHQQQPPLHHQHQPQHQHLQHHQHLHPSAAIQKNGTSSVATSEDGEESSSMPEEEDDTQAIMEHLSSVQSPLVDEITSRSALFQWTAPSPLPPSETLPFNAQDLHYEVLLSDPGKENKYKSIFKGNSLSCMVQDLKPGQEYTVRLQVYLDQLHGAPTEPTVFNTPACEPDVPKAPTLLARTKNSLQLRWNAAADNGAHITNYILEYDNGKYNGVIHLINSQNCDFVEVCKTKGKQFTINKLHPSMSYIFRLSAVNEYGRSGYSDLVKFDTAGNPPSQPAPPTLQHATATSLKLAWQRRSSSEGFTLQMNDLDQGYGYKNIYTGPDTVYECVGLRRATTFQFRVKAENENGISPFSKEVVFKTMPSCPSRPAKPQVKGKIHATGFKVKWDPPVDTGGAEINLYHLEISSGAIYERIYSGKESEAMIDRLSPGTTYQIRVLCEGPGGISAFSDLSLVTTEPEVPGVPPKPHCNGAPTPYAACLIWEKPDYNGGAPVLEYEMEVETTNKSRNPCYRGKDQFCVVKDLRPGEMYTIQVRAINRIGAGGWSEVYSFHAGAAPPNTPKDLSITLKSPTHLTVIWEEPHCNGAPISEYILQSSTSAEQLPQSSADELPYQTVYHGLQRTADLKNLAPFTNYHFRVCAVNSAGSSRYSAAFSQKTPAAPPNVPVLGQHKITARSILICWETPQCNGSPIIHYRIECGDRVIVTDAASTLCKRANEQTSNRKFDELEDSDRDEEEDSDEDEEKDEQDDNSSDDMTERAEANPVESSIDIAEANNTNRNEMLIDELHPESSYKLRIQAVNEIGNGSFSPFIKFTTAPLPPKPPKLECIQFGFAHLKLRWGEGKNLADLARYYVEIENNRTGEYQNVYTGTRSTCKVMKLHELTSYTFRIAVETKHAGMGDFSEDFVFATLAATPNTIKAPRVYIEPLGGSGGSANSSPQHPSAATTSASSSNGSVSNLTVVQGSTHLTTGSPASGPALLTIEWQTSRNNPFSDLIEYVLQMAKAKDQEFSEVYRGPGTRHTIHNLTFGLGYLFKVCPVRMRANGEEIHGQFSPVLHHQLTQHRPSFGSHSRHSGHDEVDGSGTKYYAGNVVNRRGELILSGSDSHHHSGSTISSASTAQSLLHLPKSGNLVQMISELLETDSSKAVVGVLVFIVLSVIVAAFLK